MHQQHGGMFVRTGTVVFHAVSGCFATHHIEVALVRSSFRAPHPVDMEPFVLVGYKKIFDEAYDELMEERAASG